MIFLSSLVTSIKDYVEVIHKLVETDSNFHISTYYDFGAILTFCILGLKNFFTNVLSFQWVSNIWSIPTIVPEISSALISEISIFDGSYQSSQAVLENPISYGNQNVFLYCIEKFMIGLLNSVFLIFPTSVSHIITLRRFVMQGIEAGFISGLGTIAGNIVWIGSIVFGLRFIIVPWLSLDLFRYFLGFLLILKYMWDSYTEKKFVLEDLSKYKIFFLTFLLSFTEQTTIYPFLSNVSFGSDTTLFETFPTQNIFEFFCVHGAYLLGIFLGSFSFLQFTCWFWENPAFQIYMWFISSFKATTNISAKFLNLVFLYLTMICAISNITYFGLDYTLTNPLGFLHEDRLLDEKTLVETSFLNTKASDRNTRRNRGRHGRRERWKRRVRRYRTFDASLYDQAVYDLFPVEDLNYGFDRFWLRRKIRNHRVRFRFFPGPWMRSFKKQLSRPRLESFMGPRVEFFRILFEQAYHPEFHEFTTKKNIVKNQSSSKETTNFLANFQNSIYWNPKSTNKEILAKQKGTLRKFLRKVENRMKISKIQDLQQGATQQNLNSLTQPISLKGWNSALEGNNSSSLLFKDSQESFFFKRFYNTILLQGKNTEFSQKHLSKKQRFLERYKTFLKTPIEFSNSQEKSQKSKPQKSTLYPSTTTMNSGRLNNQNTTFQNESQFRSLTLFHPLKFYLQKDENFKKKFQFYGVKLFRNFGIENNAPYFRVMMKRFFYHYKPTLRWERTLRVATMRRARRKNSRIPRKFQVSKQSQFFAGTSIPENTMNDIKGQDIQQKLSKIQAPTHMYSLVEKRASRYRYQIYKDVLQHWYYSPLNRLLLKFDIDAFIRRQPNSYFLTKTDEKFLHFKRQLLAEYYDTFRWYTYMQHYSTMKNQIGGTKSLSNRAYNQQFTGTFKKIRHLFNITPSIDTLSVLKFDQPLYNEYKSSEDMGIAKDSFIHEELLADENISLFQNKQGNGGNSFQQGDTNPEDFPDQSLKVLRYYLLQAKPIREQYIQSLLKEKNYWDLTRFLFKGQKNRGTTPISNETELLNQEQFYLLSNHSLDTRNPTLPTKFETWKFHDELWISLFQKCQNRLYDQEAIKNYVLLKKEKYELQKQNHEKYLQKRFEKIQKSFFETSENGKIPSLQSFQNFSSSSALSKSSLQKALKESIFWEKNSGKNSSYQPIEKLFQKTNFPQKIQIRSKFHFQNPNHVQKSLKTMIKKDALEILKAQDTIKQKFQKSKKSTFPISSFQRFQNFVQGFLFQTSRAQFQNQEQIDERTPISPKKRTFFFQKIAEKFPIFFSRDSKKTFSSNIDFWKNREIALGKRKKIRKTFKRLRNQQTANEKIFFENEDFFVTLPEKSQKFQTRQKNDFSTTQQTDMQIFQDENFRRSQSWKKYISEIRRGENASSGEKSGQSENRFEKIYNVLFSKNFQRKRSRLRRYSSFKGRGPIKKRTLREKFKRQFKSLKNSANQDSSNQLKTEREKKKAEFLQFLAEGSPVGSTEGGILKTETSFQKRSQKQRRTRQIKNRVWKKKKQNFAQKRRKLRKRRRSTISKIRVFNKKLHRILGKKETQTWWWKIFVPTFQENIEKNWQIEKNRQIQKQLGELSEKEIFERDTQAFKNIPENFRVLQIGDQDYKPFSIPEASRIREKLQKNNVLRFSDTVDNNSERSQVQPFTSSPKNQVSNTSLSGNQDEKMSKDTLFEKFTKNVFTNSQTLSKITPRPESPLSGAESLLAQGNRPPFFLSTNPTPFYAGWDENLRKFIVTNRFLSRKQSLEYSNSFFKNTPQQSGTKTFDSFEYEKAPLRGMNAATTLYWQIPFTTYDPDQFFALGMDGFSPLGWRNFSLKHSKQTTRPILVENFFSFQKNDFSTNLQLKFFEKSMKNQFSKSKEIEKNFEYRRIMKKQKRLKKHPRPPVWFPSGPLTQQVLPVHYIYVFYKRSRLPRDRYIRRRLRSNFEKNQTNSFGIHLTDFTLRKRIKPRRKYHRKRFLFDQKNFSVRRRKFRSFVDETTPGRKSSESERQYIRPSSKFADTRFQQDKLEKRLLQGKQKRKSLDSKQSQENLRIRQLRRRVQRQVFRPVLRYRPRSGGFVWPGDYLRLEVVKAPQLDSSKMFGTASPESENREGQRLSGKRKIRKKKRATLQEWQIQPKKYLLEKHNLKVLKKRSEKSLRNIT